MASYIVPAFGGRNADLIEARDRDIGSADNGLPTSHRVRTGEESKRSCIGPECIVEYLVEVTDTEQDLIRQFWGQYGVQYQVVVLNVKRGDFEVLAQVRACGCQSQTGSRGLGLASLPHEPVERQVFVGSEVMIQFNNTVIAVSSSGNRREVVARNGRKVGDGTGPQTRKQA